MTSAVSAHVYRHDMQVSSDNFSMSRFQNRNYFFGHASKAGNTPVLSMATIRIHYEIWHFKQVSLSIGGGWCD